MVVSIRQHLLVGFRILTGKRLIAFSLFASCITLLCMGLGVWQLQRYFQKQDLIHQQELGRERPPVDLEQTLREKKPLLPQQHVRLCGKVYFNRGMYLGLQKQGDQVVSHLLVPLKLMDQRFVLVDAGWSATPLSHYQLKDLPEANVCIDGSLRPFARGNLFTPAPDEKTRTLYASTYRDACALSGVELERIGVVRSYEPLTPHFKAIRRHENDQSYHPPHLSYAVTWFMLALIWLGLLLYFIKRRDAHCHIDAGPIPR